MSFGNLRGRKFCLRNWKERIATSCIEEDCRQSYFQGERSESSCGQVRSEMPVGHPSETVDQTVGYWNLEFMGDVQTENEIWESLAQMIFKARRLDENTKE